MLITKPNYRIENVCAFKFVFDLSKLERLSASPVGYTGNGNSFVLAQVRLAQLHKASKVTHKSKSER